MNMDVENYLSVKDLNQPAINRETEKREREREKEWPPHSAVTGLSLVDWYCPVPADALSVSPSGRGPGSVATWP